MKNLTTKQARVRRGWMIALFVLTLVLLVLTPFFVLMTVGGGFRDLLLYPETAGLTMIVCLLLWPVGLISYPNCLVATAALVFCGVVIAQELWWRKRFLEETYELKKKAVE